MINVFKPLLISLFLFNINVLYINCFTDLETKYKINRLDDSKNNNSNNNPSNYAIGLQLAQSNSDKSILIEFDVAEKGSLLMLVGENQRFYDLTFFSDLQAQFDSDLNNIDFESLSKYLSLILREAKYFKVGDKIKINRLVSLTVKKITDVRLSKEFCSYDFFKNDNYMFFLSNIPNLIFDDDSTKLHFFIEYFVCTTLAALVYGGLKSFEVFFSRYSRERGSSASAYKAFLEGTVIGALSYSIFLLMFSLLSKRKPSPVITQPGKVAVSKTDYLSKKMKQLSDCNVSFAKIEFVDEGELTDKPEVAVGDSFGFSVFDEKLVDAEGNPIKDEKGNVAHLFVIG